HATPTVTSILYLHDALPISAFYEVQKESVLIPWIKRIALILVAIGILLALFLGIRMMTQKHQKSRQLQEKVQGKNKPRKRVDPKDRKSTRLNSSHVSISYAV